MEIKLLYIEKENLVGDIQKKFNALYPFLKIEILHPTIHVKLKDDLSNSKIKKIESYAAVRSLTPFPLPAQINVSGHQTVSRVENDFKDILGLLVQFYRKSNHMWIGISLTKDLTLEQQNREAEQLSEQ